MAFTIRNHPKATKLHRLSKDTKCYKILALIKDGNKQSTLSPWMNHLFEFDKKYKVLWFREPSNKKEFEYKPEFAGKDLCCIFSGYNSFVNTEEALNLQKTIPNKEYVYYVFECIIPKGSKMYFDPILQSMISNQIIITKKKILHG